MPRNWDDADLTELDTAHSVVDLRWRKGGKVLGEGGKEGAGSTVAG